MTELKLSDFIRHLKEYGCEQGSTKNSHVKWVKDARQAPIPMTHKWVSPGVIRDVCKRLEIPTP